MALTTEDGTGLAGAESYLSVADADTYWSNRGDATWAAATTAGKEESLRRATQYLDATFNWMGSILQTTQALGWPRAGAWDREERDLSDQVPTLVEQATAELAKEALSGALVSTIARTDQAIKVKAGSVEVEFDPDTEPQKVYALAARLVAQLTVGRYDSHAVVNLLKA
jgi:hypothetical protein